MAWVRPERAEVFPLSRNDLHVSVLTALGDKKNGSAPGPYGISYRLINAVKDMRLGWDLIEEIVDNLLAGVIPAPWREMRVVFIPKPDKDPTATMN